MKNVIMAGLGALFLAACGGETALAPIAEQMAPAPRPAITDMRADGWTAMTLPELSEALAAGDVTSLELTQAFMDRSLLVNATLQSVIALNPDLIDQAVASDIRRRNDATLGPLDGIPILLKDNIESADPIPTTAGALALKDNITGRDSPLVAGLRAEGAVIFGKANLSQWANFRSEGSISGWSALGGQVRNPHILDRSPCGSSSGSGAAVAASIAAGAVGTETNGSIICPAQVNGVVGFKPTVGLISQEHIIPISASQDTAGPMTKSVRGAAMMMDAMAPDQGFSYAGNLSPLSLQGLRVGVLRFAEGSNPDIIARFNDALGALETQGAVLVEIDDFAPDAENFWGKSRAVLDHEFKAGLDAYLAASPADIPVRSLDELIAFNLANDAVELALFDQSIFDQAATMPGLDDAAYLGARADVQRAAGRDGIDAIMTDYEVDVLVSPSGPVASQIDPVNGDVWPSWAGAGYLAAIAGYPHLTVPMGDVHGIPVGLSFMGQAETDVDILSFGYAYEQASGMRVAPQYLATSEERPEIKAAMARRFDD